MRYLATFWKDFCNNKKIVTLPSKRFTNVTEYVIMHDFFSEQTLKLICMYTYMYIAVYIGLTSREYDDVMRQIWATCDACFQYQMWKRSNYTLYSLKEFLTWRFFMSPLLSHHDMRLVYNVHLLLLDNLISTLFEHLKILWFILSIYYLLLFVHLLMPTV